MGLPQGRAHTRDRGGRCQPAALRSLALRVCVAISVACSTASAGELELGVGGTVIAASGGGESLTKLGGGLAIEAGYGVRVRDDLTIAGRLLAGSTIEDEQHAHDNVILGATARLGRAASRGWVEGGLGVGFYRGRYRYDSFFDDANYDSEIATPTLLLGGGLVLHRGATMNFIGRVDVAISPFGGEVSTGMLQLTFGVSWR